MTLASACIKRKMALSPSSPRFSFWKEERTENERIAWKFIFFFPSSLFERRRKGRSRKKQAKFISILFSFLFSFSSSKMTIEEKRKSKLISISILSMKEKNWKKCFWIRIFVLFQKKLEILSSSTSVLFSVFSFLKGRRAEKTE